MLEKKQICTIFLFEFKMGYKVAETTHNINNAFDLETANEHPVQRTFKKLQRRQEPWVMRSRVDSNTQVTTPSWEDHLWWSSCNYIRNCQRIPCQPVHGCLGIWSKLERWKSLISRCLIREQIKNFKNHRFAVSKHRFLCYRNKQTYFSLAKNVLIAVVPILINKDVFETNYNALTWLETTITFVPT